MGKAIGTVRFDYYGAQVQRLPLQLGYEPLNVRIDGSDLMLDVLVEDTLPEVQTAVCLVDVHKDDSVPRFCGRHLGSVGCLHLFEVDPRSLEAQ